MPKPRNKHKTRKKDLNIVTIAQTCRTTYLKPQKQQENSKIAIKIYYLQQVKNAFSKAQTLFY